MLKINTKLEKDITFEVQIEGISDFNQLKSFFRIVINDIEYGFPCKVTSEAIEVHIPPLDDVVGKIKNQEVEVKLEVVSDGNFLTPWHGTAKLEKPLVIEAKIKDETEVPKIETKLMSKDKKSTTVIQEKKIKETPNKKSKTKDVSLEEFKKNLDKDGILKYMAKEGTKNPKIQEIVYEQAAAKSKSDEPIDILKNVIKILRKKHD